MLRNGSDGAEETVNAHALFLMIGARPHTDWLPPTVERDTRGFVMTGPDLTPTHAGRSVALRCRWRPASRESSRSGTSDTDP